MLIIVAKVLVAAAALASIFGGLLADFVIPRTARQHIYNPNWPPHAKFHNGQSIVLGVLLGILSLYLIFKPSGDLWLQFLLGVLTASFYWISLIVAARFPHTEWVDPEFAAEMKRVAGLHPQHFISYVLLVMLAIAFILGSMYYI